MQLIRQGAQGLFHASNDEAVSRYDWTTAILVEARRAGLIDQMPIVEPVTTDFFKSPMRRPKHSVLDNSKLANCLGRPAGSWRDGLRKMLAHDAVSSVD